MNARNKNLFKYILPAIIGQVCFFLFTIIDGIFVGNGVGEDALGAVNICMPFVIGLNALYMLVTVGGVTVYAVRTGRNDHEGANLVFMHACLLMLAPGVAFTVVGTTLSVPIGYMLGANETYIGYVSDYLVGYSAFIVPASMSILFQFFVRNDGSPVLVMVATIASSCLNIFLDWLFVYPLRQGIAGASIATGISQTVGLIIILFHFILRKGHLRFGKFGMKGNLFGKIFLRGAPETVSQFAVPVATLCMNKVLLLYLGETAVNAFSVISYVASFAAAIFLGVSEGAQPLLGQAYGEKDEKSLKYYFKACFAIDLFGSAIVYVALLFVGNAICSLFGADAETSGVVTRALPAYGWGFIVMSLNTIVSAYLYSTKRTIWAVELNVFRSFVFTTLITLLLPALFGGTIIWYTFGIYESISLALAFVLLKSSERKRIIFR